MPLVEGPMDQLPQFNLASLSPGFTAEPPDPAPTNNAVDTSEEAGDPAVSLRQATPDVPLDHVCETLAASAQAHGLPVPFFARLIWHESRFDQRAVSSAGAQGVAQFMPKVAAELGLGNPFDPIAALPVSARFLQSHYQTFGNLGLAAAAYNAGPRRILDWLARRGKLPGETRNYVIKITGHAPEKWIEEKPLDLTQKLPPRAPCVGVAELSPFAQASTVQVQLDGAIAKIVETAKAEAARAAKAKAAKLAKAKGAKAGQLASGRAKGKTPAKGRVRLAENSERR